MFGSMVLEVAIGVIFAYLLLSLIVTAVTELISGWLKWRAKDLRAGLQRLLNSEQPEKWVSALYEHPLIQGLTQDRRKAASADSTAEAAAGRGPSYIPSRTFAIAFLDVLRDEHPAGRLLSQALHRVLDTTPDSASMGDLKKAIADEVRKIPDDGIGATLKQHATALVGRIPDNVPLAEAKGDLRAYAQKLSDLPLQTLIENLPDAKLRKALLTLLEDSNRDVESLKETLEVWFNNSMARVSGWYKRKTQTVHVLLAIVLTLVINVDTVLLVDALSTNQALRQSLVAEAEAYADQEKPANGQPGGGAQASDPAENYRKLRAQLDSLDLPIGWLLPGERKAPPGTPPELKNADFRDWPGWWAADMTEEQWTKWASLWGDTIRFHLFGWVLTAFAISLGAPFWFDMLNKVINIRSSGKAPEEKPKAPKEVPKPLEPGETPVQADLADGLKRR
ncbi:MAG TPA: hypothetical protein VF756_31060 [Thermoanaerobaculia bacterium]